jgi:hypothetical protein
MHTGAAGFSLERDQVLVGLGALKAVALANKELAEAEKELIDSAAKAFGVEVDVSSLEVPKPDQVASAFVDPAWRERLVQALIVMSLIDGEPSNDEIAIIASYADALGIDEPRVKNLHQLLAGRIGAVRFDMIRRTTLPKMLFNEIKHREGWKGAFKFVRGMVKGEGEQNPDLAWRYKQLGLLREGTLGREFWKHMTKNKFGMPGEPGGLMELSVAHDMTHVLCGFDTDPEGETQVASFMAGFYKEDPFSFVFMVLMMFHLGIKLSPIATPAKGQFHPDKVFRAMQRGAGLNRDLMRDWDWWQDVELPIDEVRQKYGIAETASAS